MNQDTLAGTIRKLEAILAELHCARDAMRVAEEAEAEAATEEEQASKFHEFDLLDSGSAALRFREKPDTIRKWCREEGIGIRRGGRWLVSVSRLKARLGY